MKVNFTGILVVFITLLLFSCSTSQEKKDDVKKGATTDSTQHFEKNYLTDCKKLFAEARKVDSILLNQTEVDKPSAIAAIKAFTDFAYYCQDDSLSPVFLIKTAQVARAINNVPQAKLALDRCIETYPSFKNRPAALFLLAQLYEEKTYLNNGEEARKLYQKIIDEYPKSDWASNAKGAIRFIGKTDEEILKELKKKQKR